tara:strand:+ start:1187 stop:2881 length:1695 start_codon:yes stop_codon:yes gene_type:complete
MKNIKILDCTLRDGGYYTDWNFNKELVLSTVKAAHDAGMDYIELGYKSPVKGGVYKKCNDGFLKSILPLKDGFYVFMIDLKDYVIDGKIDYSLLRSVVKRKDFFSVCRIAIKYSQLNFLQEVYTHIKNMGYSVIVNVMAITDLTELQMDDCVSVLSRLDVEAVYFADSYGNLLPSQIEKIVSKLKRTKKNIGFHSHDNMGLAFANTLRSIELGVKYIDCTMTGMGRGVGNLKTEQLLLYLGRNIDTIVNTIEEHYHPMQIDMGWGFSLPYMYSSLAKVHPLTSQQINSADLGLSDKMRILAQFENQMSYDRSKVTNCLNDMSACVIIPARYKSTRFPGKPLALIAGKEMILHVCEKAEQAVGKSHVYVATEDRRIAEVVNSAGYNFVITSDTCLTGTDRVAEASKELDYDIYVNLQGDEPLVNPEDIKAAIQMKKENFNTVVNCVTKINDIEEMKSKSVPKMVYDDNNNLLYASRSSIPGSKEGVILGYKQVCIYCFNSKELELFADNSKSPNEKVEDIEILRLLDKGVGVKLLILDSSSVAVDYPKDVEKVENILNNGEKNEF